MDNEARKKYCSLLMFDMSCSANPSSPTAASTLPSPMSSPPTPSSAVLPATSSWPTTPTSPSAHSNSDGDDSVKSELFLYETGDISLSPATITAGLRQPLQPAEPSRKRERPPSIVTIPPYTKPAVNQQQQPQQQQQQQSNASYATTTISLDDLPSTSHLPPPPSPPATKKQFTDGAKPERTPRPPNAFILYRRHVQPSIIARYRNISNAEISQKLSVMWREEPDSVKLLWRKEADRKKMEHMAAHPDYVYRPRKPGTRQKKKRSRVMQQSNGNPQSPYSCPATPVTPGIYGQRSYQDAELAHAMYQQQQRMMAAASMYSPPLSSSSVSASPPTPSMTLSPVTPSPATPVTGMQYMWPTVSTETFAATQQHYSSRTAARSPLCGEEEANWGAASGVPLMNFQTEMYNFDNLQLQSLDNFDNYNYLALETGKPIADTPLTHHHHDDHVSSPQSDGASSLDELFAFNATDFEFLANGNNVTFEYLN